MRIPPVTLALLLALAIAYLLQKLAGDVATVPLMLWPLGEQPLGIDDTGRMVVGAFRPWQLLTYAFLHDPSNLAHLLFNALAFYQFGPSIEQAWGSRRYAVYLLACIAGAGVLQLVVAAVHPEGASGPVIGASGGVFAVLLAYGMQFPNRRLLLLIPPIPMKARTMVIVFGAIELVLGATGAQPGIAHFVHLGGLLVGWVLITLWRRQRRLPPAG
jgi:membrane associated rhomboid family serine protease